MSKVRKSRSIDDLRADVAANCRILIALAAKEGLPVLVTETTRDDEYQASLYAKGRTAAGGIVTNTPTPSFHSERARLAFDICKNMAGHEYDDAAFFDRVGAIGKRIGFSWGGDWKAFPDRPHFQWDENGRYTGAMVRAEKYPAAMPRYDEEDEMTQEVFNQMLENYFSALSKKEASPWSGEARAWAEEKGIITGDEEGSKQYKSFLTREQMVVLLKRFAQLKK